MKRLALSALSKWVNEPDRKPLILRGARQVGKSTLVRLLAQEAGLDLIEINLENTNFAALAKDNFVLTDWLTEIELKANKRFNEKTLLFLDEIQQNPKALQKLRYLYEERPDLLVIAAGSLLDLLLHREEISFPVGRVSFFWLGPMTFSEYLLAAGRETLAQAVQENKIPAIAHDILIEELKKYFFIGGMPKAVLEATRSGSLLAARTVHRDLMQAYFNDFPRYGRRLNVERLQAVFNALPAYLGKKLIYQHLDRDSRSAEVKACVDLLIRAGLIIPCYHTDAEIPAMASRDTSVLKPYFLDIGLVNYAHQMSWDELEVLFSKGFTTKGYLAEQFVAQHFAFSSEGRNEPSLLYWLRDKSSLRAEIDFILQKNGQILPVEVKAETGGKLRSLKLFCNKKKIYNAIKISKEPPNLVQLPVTSDHVVALENVPLYAIEKIGK
jgi:predicted AAA+ superfamily ATPase